MKKLIASVCVVGSLLASPLQSFTDTKIEASSYAKNGWSYEAGSWYYYSNNNRVTGWQWDGSNWYYLAWNGTMVRDFQYINGAHYYFNGSGAMVTGWQKINGSWYVFDNSGAMKTGWHFDGSRWYYLAWNGTMVTGWQKLGGAWYSFDNSGAMRTGWYNDGSQWYYLNNSGGMATGWQKINGVWYFLNDSGEWIQSNVADSLKTIGNNQQLVLVTAGSYGTNNATVQTFEKKNDKWVPITGAISGHIGRDGFAYQMSEWVTQSPRGKFTIGTAFGRYGNPGTKLPFHQIQSNDVWVDDSNSEFYNTLQQSPAYGRWNSAENMNISAYNYGFVINYNTERTPGKGSAVFFHVSDSWTAGCTGVSQQNVINILRWLDPNKNPVIIQTPDSELGSY
ncbi:L,D-transpeptidase family protein [Microbacteriaceae bacterium 4G12]